MDDFRFFKKIDAHIHYNSPRTILQTLGQEYGFRYLTINIDTPFFPSIDEQSSIAQNIKKTSPSILESIGTFRTLDWDHENWPDLAKLEINAALDNGACGIKVWKNIGMSLRDSSGRFVMIDNPRFDPLFDMMVAEGVPVIGHLGEPRNCWLPLDQMSVRSDREYYSGQPEYHMHRHPEYPSYDDQIRARNSMLDKHPRLRFVGAHLASLEWSVDEVAKWLDRFPNAAVDLAERINHLQLQSATNRNRVIAFFEKYQNRIIYGTDIIEDGSLNEKELRNKLVGRWTDHWKFFSSGDVLHSGEFKPPFQGLNLSESILEKIYWKNARSWYSIYQHHD